MKRHEKISQQQLLKESSEKTLERSRSRLPKCEVCDNSVELEGVDG